MKPRPASRLLEHLPAIYRGEDTGDELRTLLGVFEAFLFDGEGQGPMRLEGIARRLAALPGLFAPLGREIEDDAEPGASAGQGNGHEPDEEDDRTPRRFLPWLASWLAFSPRGLFEPERLRRVVAGIVPLYGRRGTRVYLEALLTLCFEEIAAVRIDEHEHVGLRVGLSRVGVDSLLAEERPFWFRVDIDLRRDLAARPAASARFEEQVRAVIEFAKPAHTAYELRMHRGSGHAAASDQTSG
jgi:phage tail-like protein